MKMQIFEVVLNPSVFESQTEDVALVRASTIKGAAQKFCREKKMKLGPQVREYEPGPRGTRAAFRVMKNWGMFGGIKQYSLTVKEADIF